MEEDFDKKFAKERQESAGPDVNEDGVVDGSPESIKKMGEDLGQALSDFFKGLLDGFSKKSDDK